MLIIFKKLFALFEKSKAKDSGLAAPVWDVNVISRLFTFSRNNWNHILEFLKNETIVSLQVKIKNKFKLLKMNNRN